MSFFHVLCDKIFKVNKMRLDKYLKVSRLIKRREAAKQFIDKGYVLLNDKVAKPSSEVKIDDIIQIVSPLGGKSVKAKGIHATAGITPLTFKIGFTQ